MTTKEKNKAVKAANKFLFTLCQVRHQGLPIGEVIDNLKANGFDLTENLEGIYCNDSNGEGRVHEEIGSGCWIAIQWKQGDNTNTYEFNAYVS